MRDARTAGTTTGDATVRMFRSDFMERLTHVQPWVPHLLYIPVVAVCLWLAPTAPPQTALLFVVGLLLWTLTEYLMHRFVFHWPDDIMNETHAVVESLPAGEAAIPRMPSWKHLAYFIGHGVHHVAPTEPTRLVMPPGASIPLALLFFAIFRLLFGAAELGAFAGFVTGYLVYDTIHYAVHHQGLPTRWGRYLKKRHARHHYVDADEDYGVSSPLWDLVFGTFSRKTARG